mmetsp:Transcript_1601/g.4167  ORF Transcript_1601/g.4167 Transcript_1601/m.4167 type:complete len:369 (+) Transcript_1601:347-1453(+)
MAAKGSPAIRALVLVVLTVQTSVFHLVLRVSRSQGAAPYSALAAVCYTEMIKFVASWSVLALQSGGFSAATSKLMAETRENRRTSRMLLVPAVLYAVQNTLVIYAISDLSAAEFAVARQIKVPVTGVFSVLLLNRELGIRRWCALLMVASGVAIVQLAKTSADGYKILFFHGPSLDSWEHSMGILFALGSCITSGLAAVWFEMVLKSSNVDLWVMNIQLAAFSVLITGSAVLISSGMEAFLSFDRVAVLAVTFSASDGLVIALVMKYADAILKGFATSVAICITAWMSVLMGDQPASGQLALGCGIVATSVVMYAWSSSTVRKVQRKLSQAMLQSRGSDSEKVPERSSSRALSVTEAAVRSPSNRSST